ncbi:threonine-phosphate decarboxylase CobD [Magnetovibrio sp. PR-2]|uniref:threonine-phosphate decarboxylase CobD n=1 Tax=Magnetovibrio sp. PR-2 TaxID=3120356 RepID=UPI002FCE03BF
MNELDIIKLGQKPVLHGGDPKAAEARFGVPKQGWVDLSTGINPKPYPLGDIPAEVFARLPFKSELDDLLAAARKAYGVPDEAGIVASAGTQALIQLAPTLFDPGDVTIMGPTYGEHAPAWRGAGHNVVEVGSICAQAAEPSPFGVSVHPNNPTGRLQAVDGLVAMAGELFDRGGALVVDEAFIDVVPDLSITPHAGCDGLIVLRSFGKFYGLAGLRLGFAITTPDLAERLNEKIGPWAVSGPALYAGTKALSDPSWADQTRKDLSVAMTQLNKMLTHAGLRYVGGTDLFTLVEHEDAQAIYEKLGRAGILVRPFDYNTHWLRFGLPGTQEHWQRLEAALKS